MTVDERLAALSSWVGSVLAAKKLVADASEIEVSVASADASFRRYFRITAADGRSWIGMDAPPEKENSTAFVSIAELICGVGVNAPTVIEADLERGYLLLSDLGSSDYLDHLQPEWADDLYGDAIYALVQMQLGLDEAAKQLPEFDDALYAQEYSLFTDWLLGTHLDIRLSADERKQLDACYALLQESAIDQPQVFVHRDYHSRNLMLCTPAQGGNPGVIDFQDAVLGPLSYDLVSLLRDCYITWSQADIDRWLAQYLYTLHAAGGPSYEPKQFKRWFDWMGLQRHIKAIGIFARLAHRDGKTGYLADMPRTGRYIADVAGSYPELTFLRDLMLERVLPALEATTTDGQ